MMKKAKYKECFGTSFHGVTILASVDQIKEVCGDPSFCNPSAGVAPEHEKVTVEWDMLTEECLYENGSVNRPGLVFTIYDFKEYREFPDDEIVEFHIGAECERYASIAKDELEFRMAGLDLDCEYFPPM